MWRPCPSTCVVLSAYKSFVRFLKNWCRSCLQKLLSMHGCCEDQLSASCTLLKGVNEFLIVMYVFPDHFGLNFVYEIFMYYYSVRF